MNVSEQCRIADSNGNPFVGMIAWMPCDNKGIGMDRMVETYKG